MEALGIDLGTTNTVAAVGSQVLPLDQGGTMPSVVAFLPNGAVEVGRTARRRRAIDGANTVFSAKRIIGRPWNHPDTLEFRDRYPFHLVELGDWPAFETRAGTFTPTQIAGILLSRIFEHLSRVASGLDIAVTVPAGFAATQREATLAAAREARFADVRLIHEPMAAARAYLTLRGTFARVGVYDLGGGTFDFAVLDCRGESPELLGSGSDLYLGGDDVDHEIARWVATEVLKQHNWDLTNYPEVQDRLLAECERAKIRLSVEEETLVDLSQIDPELPASASGLGLRREGVDRLADDLVRRTFITCDHVLRDVGLGPRDLDAVLLAGGSTHLPMVKRGVEHYFGQPGRHDLEPTEVVAVGASLDAALA